LLRAAVGGDAGGRPPTPAMKRFANSIARQKRIKPPPGYTKSGSICRAFVDQHAPKKADVETSGELGSKPASPAQMLFAQPSPIPLSGRPAHRPFRGLLSVYSRCGLHTRAVTKVVTAIRGLQTFRHLHACPRLLPAGAVAGRGLHPLEKRRLVTAHVVSLSCRYARRGSMWLWALMIRPSMTTRMR
jgi:hypothetical protein